MLIKNQVLYNEYMAFLLLLLANGIFTLFLLWALHILRTDIKATKKETQEQFKEIQKDFGSVKKRQAFSKNRERRTLRKR